MTGSMAEMTVLVSVVSVKTLTFVTRQQGTVLMAANPDIQGTSVNGV